MKILNKVVSTNEGDFPVWKTTHIFFKALREFTSKSGYPEIEKVLGFSGLLLKWYPEFCYSPQWEELAQVAKNPYAEYGRPLFQSMSHGDTPRPDMPESKMIYVAMFDEIDEGTAIFKITDKVPVGESTFISRPSDIPSDHYLWLTGKAGKYLKDNQPLPTEKPIEVRP
ncbi:MAG: hypothetical protein JJE18_04220 [Eubacteriaceae bacterium]|nr:hypothetical protein [Eubacteriaceae bacterium]